MLYAQAALGHAVLLALAFLCSEDRRRINWRLVMSAVALEIGLAVLLLHAPPMRAALGYANDAANALQRATEAGTGFVFGYLGGGMPPFAESTPGAAYVIAFRALPMVLVISALSSLLFHWGVLQKLTSGFAWLLRRSLGISGPLALSTAVNVFVGMVEAPLLIRPYLARMQRGELFAVMAGGLAGVAGTVMVIYASFLSALVPDAMGHILVVSVISMPAALAVSAILVPFGPLEDAALGRLSVDDPPTDWMDAIVRGTMDGISPLAGIVAMLLVTVALVALVNAMLGLLPHWDGAAFGLQRIFAWPFRPVMWLIGIPWAESATAAQLMATKTVLNEFVAYRDFAGVGEALSPRSRMILTYAMCGFANFGSLGIMVGGLGAMVPARRAEIVGLGLRSILAGTLATCMCGAVAGALLG